MRNTVIASACAGFGLAAPACSQIAVSPNDHKAKQVNGVTNNADNNGKLTDTGQKIEVGGGAPAIRSWTDRSRTDR